MGFLASSLPELFQTSQTLVYWCHLLHLQPVKMKQSQTNFVLNLPARYPSWIICSKICYNQTTHDLSQEKDQPPVKSGLSNFSISLYGLEVGLQISGLLVQSLCIFYKNIEYHLGDSTCLPDGLITEFGLKIANGMIQFVAVGQGCRCINSMYAKIYGLGKR